MTKSAKPSSKTFDVNLDVKMTVCVTVQADTMEDALTTARKYKLADLVSHLGDLIDNDDPRITGLFEHL